MNNSSLSNISYAKPKSKNIEFYNATLNSCGLIILTITCNLTQPLGGEIETSKVLASNTIIERKLNYINSPSNKAINMGNSTSFELFENEKSKFQESLSQFWKDLDDGVLKFSSEIDTLASQIASKILN